MSAPLPIHQTTPDLDGLRKVLAAVLKSPEKDFDLGTWKCETTACAIGWFCTYNPGDALKLVPRPRIRGGLIPECQGKTFFPAISLRFRISDEQARNLFDNHRASGIGPRNRRELLERLEQFIMDNTPEHVIPDLHELRGDHTKAVDVFSIDLDGDPEIRAFAASGVVHVADLDRMTPEQVTRLADRSRAHAENVPLVLGTLNATDYDAAHQRADAQEEDGERWSGLE